MSQYVRFYKVASLPAVLNPDSLYYVSNGDYSEAYITDLNGVAKKVGNTAMIEALTRDVDGGVFV